MSRRAHANRLALQWRVLLSLAFCLVLAFAPTLAEARAGRSFSIGGAIGSSGIGSRGTRTFEQNRAAPITRSMQTPSATRPLSGGPAYGGSFFQRHPFLTGIAGGFLGSMLFSHMGGFGHVLGGMLMLAIIALLIWVAIRLFSGRGFAFGAMGAAPGGATPRSVGAAAAPASLYRGQDTTVDDRDLSAFQSIHAAVQEAWGNSDLGRLRPLMTPEMLSYFSEELTRNASQGVQNVVSNVNLLKGEITESWVEDDLQYATAYLQWSALDFVVRLGSAPGAADSVVSGDPRTPVESEETWTFVRRRGGNWLLSAVQQV